jgi:hypothetical protein
VKIEYVTDPVLVPGLRCPRCHAKVRQIRRGPSARAELTTALLEPVGWVVLGGAALVGYLWEALFGLTLALLVVGPVVAVWCYLRAVRHGDFLCVSCGTEFLYAQVASRK